MTSGTLLCLEELTLTLVKTKGFFGLNLVVGDICRGMLSATPAHKTTTTRRKNITASIRLAGMLRESRRRPDESMEVLALSKNELIRLGKKGEGLLLGDSKKP